MINNIERRIKKDIRITNPFSKGEKILVLDNRTKESFLIVYLLKRLAKQLKLDIIIKKQKNIDSIKGVKGYKRVILPFDADDIINNFIKNLAKGKLGKQKQNLQTILKSVLDSEVAEAAKKIGYQAKKTEGMLDKLEQKYPGSKFAALKSINLLNGLK